MKNLKKLLAVVIVAAMMITTMLPAMAAKIENAAEANALHALGLYQGTSTTGFEPALDQPLTREQGAAMLIRLLGEEALAKALSSSDVSATLVIFSDVDAISDWARPYVAYGVRESLIAGNANGTFNPQGPLLGKDFATMILRALGYTVNASTYEAAAAELAKAGGLDMGTAVVVNNKELTRDDMVGMAYQSLQAKYKGTDETVIGRLVKNGVVSEADAISNGVYNGELAKAAEAAVSAYEAAPITTLEEIEASASALAAANAAVAKIVVEADKAAFQARIDAKLAAAEANKAAILAADEAAKQAIENAKAAVEAYENAADTTAAEVESAKALKAAADEAVAAVKDATIKADFEARVAARAAELEALAAEYKAQADAQAAVAAYENAPFATLEQIAAAKALEATAVEKIAAVKDATVKAALEARVAAQKALVTANEIKISPASVSVSMTNLKNIIATFNKALDKDTVIENNIKVEIDDDLAEFNNDSDKTNKEVSKFTLSEDGKTLILSLKDYSVNQGDKIKVTFENFKDVDGVEMPKYEAELVAKDKADPVLERIEYVNQNLIRMYFSEPVDLDTTDYGYVYSDYEGSSRKVNLKLDDSAEYVEFKAIPAENIVEAKFLNAISEGQHTIEIRDISDFAGYRIDEVTFSFNAAKDSTAPYVVAVEFLAANKIKVIYNEKITAHGINTIKQVTDDTNYWTDADVKYVDNDTAVEVTFAPGLKFDVRATVGFSVKYKSAKDLVGNSSGEKTFEAKAIDDTTVPDVVKVSVIEDNKIRVIFTEDINTEQYTAFTIYKTDGKTLLASAADEIEEVEDLEHAYDLKFDIVDELDAGDYQLKIAGLKDVSIRGNVMPDKTFTISFTDVSKPELVAAVYDWDLDNDGRDEGDDYIYLTFSKAMDYETISDIKNYFILNDEDGTLRDLNSYKVNGEKAKITSITNGGRKVTIKVPYASTVFSGDIYMCVVGLKDTLGNYLENAILGSRDVKIETDYPQFNQDVVTVAATGRNTIEITIAKNTQYTFSSANNKAFKFVNAYGSDNDIANVGVRAAAISSDGRKITLTTAYTLTYDAKANLANGGSAKLRLILDSGSDFVVKDGNGVAIDLDLPVLDKITPSQKDGDKDAGGKYDSLNKTWKTGNVVTVNFEERIAYAQAGSVDPDQLKGALTGSIEIIGPDGKALLPVTDYEAWVENGAVKIKINKEYDRLVTLTYQFKQPELLKDEDGPVDFTGVSVKGACKIKNVITKAPAVDWTKE